MNVVPKHSIYRTNRGVNAPLEIYGISDQHLVMLIVGILGSFFFFVILHVAQVSIYISLTLSVSALVGTYLYASTQSKKYGSHGMARLRSGRKSRRVIEIRSRSCFLQLSNDKPHAKNK